MIRLLRRRRLQLTAAVTVFLVLAGGSGATAYWSGQAQLQAQAGAASMGLAFQLLPTAATSPLAVTYTAQSRVAAGAVTISNTGSREAPGELLISAESPTSSQLPASISVVVAPVAAAADCTPQLALTAPTVRTLSTTSTSFPIAGTLAAGATTVLCVQTTLAQSAAAPAAVQSLQLAIGAKLTYAQAAGWSIASPISRLSQSVAAVASALVIHDYARYTIRNEGLCISRASGVSRTTSCEESSSQWRVMSAGSGTFHILAANPWGSASGRLTAAAGNSVSTATTTGGATQQWTITGPAGGPFQIKSVATGLCATVASANPRRVDLRACDGSVAQAFALQMIGTPVAPAPQQLTCSGLEWYIQLEFNAPADYQAEAEYRVLLSRSSSLGERTSYPVTVWGGDRRGFGINSTDADLARYIASNGPGNTRVTIEQSIAGTAWTTAATGDVRTSLVGSSPRIWCGWQ